MIKFGMLKSRSSETRKITVRVQFYNSASGGTTPPTSKVVDAPFYKSMRKEHPQYRQVIDNAIADLAVEAGLPRDQRPVMTQVI
jgi:hypothetical protein